MSAPEVRIREQLRLPLERPVADAAFVVSDSNAEAVRTLNPPRVANPLINLPLSQTSA